jgi:hypothetical protein
MTEAETISEQPVEDGERAAAIKDMMDAVIVHEDGVATVGNRPHAFLQKHFHTLNSVLSAPRAAWRPMPSAPRDGTRILVCWRYWSPYPQIARFFAGSWEAECCISPTHEKAFPERQPTRWQPLPLPPNPLNGTAER